MNRAILVGRLAKDPDFGSTQSGVNVCRFTVACDRRHQTNGERQADFINCVAWREKAEFIHKYFTKGMRIALEGNIQVSSWEDQNGNKRYATDVVVDHVEFAQSKSETVSQISAQDKPSECNGAAQGNIDDFMPVDDEDLPF